MAHPCHICGSECYCHGDCDDVITTKTPKNCLGCGCETYRDLMECEEEERRAEFEDDPDEFDCEEDDFDPVGFHCLGCGHIQDHGGECEICTGYCVEPYG